jgi:hypothetical protein
VSTVTHGAPGPQPLASSLPARVWRAWRSLSPQAFGIAMLGGLALGSVQGIGAALAQTDIPLWQSFVACAFPGTVMGVVWLLCISIAHEFSAPGPRRWRAYVVAGVAAGVIGSVIDLATTPSFAPLTGSRAIGWEALRSQPLEMWWINVPVACLACAFAALAYLHLRETRHRARVLREVQLERARLARETYESRLLATQARVDPEFLFDSLRRIQQLYETDAVTAERMLDDLIVYLRAALPSLAETNSTVKSELAMIGAWVDIMRLRLGDRLSCSIIDASDSRDARIPPMMILPLVERAIRAGQESASALVRIVLEAFVARGRVRISLSAGANAFTPEAASADTLRIREHLRALYGGEATLEFSAERGGRSRAVLEIPHESADRDHR